MITTTQIKDLMKTVYAIKLTVEKEQPYSHSSVDLTKLREIAEFCPNEKGPAVFIARSLF